MKKASSTDKPSTTRDLSFVCPHDGSPLVKKGPTQGFCTKVDGYPLMRWFWHPEAKKGAGGWEAQGWACPSACPHCGTSLEWDGCCLSCGPRVGAPGNRYRRERNHWMFERGPEPPMTEAQHVNLLVRVKALSATLA
jgi:hypothetical protein